MHGFEKKLHVGFDMSAHHKTVLTLSKLKAEIFVDNFDNGFLKKFASDI